MYHDPVKIYTKTGDTGETSLLSGGRVDKDHPRIEAYGTLDELNSTIGLLLTEQIPDEAVPRLEGIQRSLFSLGAAMADGENRVEHDQSQWATGPIEEWIDGMEGDLEPLKNFILPGGCRAAAIAHVARTVCRRAERLAVAAIREADGLSDGVVEYLNRLSDGLFVLARWLNVRSGITDSVWRSQDRDDL